MKGGGGWVPLSSSEVGREAQSNQGALENAGKFSRNHSAGLGGALVRAAFMGALVFGVAVLLVEPREKGKEQKSEFGS